MNEEQRRSLLSVSTSRAIRDGDVIFRKGDFDCLMHLILSGCVELRRDDAVVAKLSTGQCIGEATLLYSQCSVPSHSLDAIAVGEVETAEFACKDFQELIRRRPDIGVVVYRNLALDIRHKLSGQ
jgi:CRP-like cAMP-binding protein